MKRLFIAPIAEGKGEVEALPRLLHRLSVDAGMGDRLQVNPVIRVRVNSFLQDEEYLRRYLAMAAQKVRLKMRDTSATVLVVLDCEDECPAQLGPRLLARIRMKEPHVPVIVTLAHREYETWFVAAAESLRGIAGLPADLVSPPSPDGIRDAKGWLGDQMPSGYDPIVHQLLLTGSFSLEQAASVPSFDRFRRRITDFLQSTR